MSANLDDARRAYEAAKRIAEMHGIGRDGFSDARLLLTNAEAEYRAALIDAAERRFDGQGIKVGETWVSHKDDEQKPFVIGRLEADVGEGSVWAYPVSSDDFCIDARYIRPYTAPEAKQMVLYGPTVTARWQPANMETLRHRLTLSNVTPADLDAMKPGDVIEGSYKIEIAAPTPPSGQKEG